MVNHSSMYRDIYNLETFRVCAAIKIRSVGDLDSLLGYYVAGSSVTYWPSLLIQVERRAQLDSFVREDFANALLQFRKP